MPTFWKYSPGGVISDDYRYQISGVDRTRYLIRIEDRFVLVNCEHYTENDIPALAVYLGEPMQFITKDGPTEVTEGDRETIMNIMASGMPIMGRTVKFE